MRKHILLCLAVLILFELVAAPARGDEPADGSAAFASGDAVTAERITTRSKTL
jgi:hypothetical protein